MDGWIKSSISSVTRPTSTVWGVATYDSTHGLVMGGEDIYELIGGRWEEVPHKWQKTHDGITFEDFPPLYNVEGAACLQTLDNGGDIFAAGIGSPRVTSTRGAAYIFRSNSSTWEQQPDVGCDSCYYCHLSDYGCTCNDWTCKTYPRMDHVGGKINF